MQLFGYVTYWLLSSCPVWSFVTWNNAYHKLGMFASYWNSEIDMNIMYVHFFKCLFVIKLDLIIVSLTEWGLRSSGILRGVSNWLVPDVSRHRRRSNSLDFRPLHTRPLSRLETSGNKQPVPRRNIPEERRSEMHSWGSLKTRKVNPVTYLIFNVLVVSEFVQNAYTDI